MVACHLLFEGKLACSNEKLKFQNIPFGDDVIPEGASQSGKM